MQRIGRLGRIQAGKEEEYLRLHREMSPELRNSHSIAGLRSFSIFRHGLDLFSYLECDDWEQTLATLAQDPLVQAWSDKMKTLLAIPLPWEMLEEVWRLD